MRRVAWWYLQSSRAVGVCVTDVQGSAASKTAMWFVGEARRKSYDVSLVLTLKGESAGPGNCLHTVCTIVHNHAAATRDPQSCSHMQQHPSAGDGDLNLLARWRTTVPLPSIECPQ